MESYITIKEKKINLIKPISYIQGDFEFSEIHNLSYCWVDWTKKALNLLKSPSILFNSLINSNDIIEYSELEKRSEKKDNQENNWIELWNQNIQNYKEIMKFSKIFNNLLRIKQLVEEREQLASEIDSLKDAKKILEKATEQDLYLSKKKHLNKLEENFSNLQNKFDIKKDEYDTYKNRVNKFSDKIDKLKNNLQILKEKQRDLFKETNDITRAIDEKYPLLDTYRNKLMNLDKNKEENKEDYQRIKRKHDDILEVVEPWKEKRQELMNQSKTIKKKVRQMRKLLKKEKKQISPFRKSYLESKKEFEKIKREYKALKEQVAKVRDDLKKIIKENQIDRRNSSVENSGNIDDLENKLNNLEYTSIYSVNNKIDQNQERINKINIKLDELFGTINRNEIRNEIEERMGKIEQKLAKIKTFQKKYSKKMSNNHFLKILLERLEKFEKNFNFLLKKIDMRMKSSMSLDKKSKKIEFQMNFLQKTKKIEIMEDLRRTSFAYFIMTMIVSYYKASGYSIIPINSKFLPHKITTQKTFTKAFKYLETEIEKINKKEENQIQLIVFLHKKYDEIETLN